MTTAKGRNDGALGRRPVLALGAAAFVAALLCSGGARAGCVPVQITVEPAPLSDEWQTAVLSLTEQLRRPGTPWSCTGGALLVQLDAGDRAVLRFRDGEGQEVERHVPSARALVASAEALLATLPPRDAARDTAPPAPADERERALELPPPDRQSATLVAPRGRGEPRYLFDATLGVRFSGPAAAVWLAPALRATVPLDAWSVGVWVRYGLPYVFEVVPTEFAMSQVNLGFSGGRQLLAAPVDVRLAFTPSLSVITMDADLPDHEVAGAKVDVYLGATVSAAVPFGRTWRGIVALDAELVPAAIRAERRIDPSLPALPAYEVGVAFGAELVAR